MPAATLARAMPGAASDPMHRVAFFLCLSMTVMLAHELTHHLAARAVCGDWGTMTLSTFQLAAACEARPWWLATLAGPLLTYALIAIGAWWRSPVGLMLVFANIPLGRIINVVTRGGDEMIIGRALFGEELAWPAIAAIVALLLGPSLWRAAQRLPRPRAAWFTAAMLLPLLWDFLGKRMLLGALLPDAPVVAGVPVAILLLFGVAAAVTVSLRPGRARSH